MISDRSRMHGTRGMIGFVLLPLIPYRYQDYRLFHLSSLLI